MLRLRTPPSFTCVLLVRAVQVLYNDVSPQENHHVAGAFILLRDDQYNFYRKGPKTVRLAC